MVSVGELMELEAANNQNPSVRATLKSIIIKIQGNANPDSQLEIPENAFTNSVVSSTRVPRASRIHMSV